MFFPSPICPSSSCAFDHLLQVDQPLQITLASPPSPNTDRTQPNGQGIRHASGQGRGLFTLPLKVSAYSLVPIPTRADTMQTGASSLTALVMRQLTCFSVGNTLFKIMCWTMGRKHFGLHRASAWRLALALTIHHVMNVPPTLCNTVRSQTAGPLTIPTAALGKTGPGFVTFVPKSTPAMPEFVKAWGSTRHDISSSQLRHPRFNTHPSLQPGSNKPGRIMLRRVREPAPRMPCRSL